MASVPEAKGLSSMRSSTNRKTARGAVLPVGEQRIPEFKQLFAVRHFPQESNFHWCGKSNKMLDSAPMARPQPFRCTHYALAFP